MNRKCQLLLCGAFSGGLLLYAQQYSLNRSRLAGGGGLSTGGSFALRGTVGQAEAGTPLTGGGYSLKGGFRSKVGIIQTPDAPKLTLTPDPDGTVTISWPSPSVGWSLQQSGQLSPESWTNATQVISETGSVRSVTIQAPPGWLFFRLHKAN